jgi:hypothetical protein
MFPRDILLPIFYNFVGLLLALVISVFVDGVSFSRHGALVCGDFVGLDQKTIGWNFHALAKLHDITNEKVVLMQLTLLTLAAHGHPFAAVSDVVELQKLSLFLIIIDSCDCSADHNCHEHSKALNPSRRPLLWFGGPDFDGYR